LLHFARREHLLFGGNGLGARCIGERLRLRLRLGFLGDRDRALLLSELERLPPVDLEALRLALARDALFVEALLGGDARLLDLLARFELRLLGLALAESALARELGTLRGALDLDLALAFDARVLAVALDFEALPLRLQILVADLDHRVLFDVV